MNPLVKTLILAGGIGAVAIVAMNAHDEQVAELSLASEHDRLRANYVERAGYVRSLVDDGRYRDELSALNKWYDAQLIDVHNRYPGRFDNEREIKVMEDAQKAGKMKAEELQSKREWYDLTKGFYDLVQSGRYDPVATAVRSGVRFDLLSMQRVTYEGKQKLRIDLAVWGAPRRELENKTDGGRTKTIKQVLDFGVKGLSFEFIDAKSKLMGGAETGAPTITIDWPERWVPAFPPQAAFGTWWIDPLPAEAVTVDLKLDAEIRSPALGALPVSIDWKLPADEAWKVKAGEKFEGKERLMPEEEMDRSANK